MSVDVAAFLNFYHDLRTVEELPPYFVTGPGPPHLVVPAVFEDIGNAHAYGGELSRGLETSQPMADQLGILEAAHGYLQGRGERRYLRSGTQEPARRNNSFKCAPHSICLIISNGTAVSSMSDGSPRAFPPIPVWTRASVGGSASIWISASSVKTCSARATPSSPTMSD